LQHVLCQVPANGSSYSQCAASVGKYSFFCNKGRPGIACQKNNSMFKSCFEPFPRANFGSELVQGPVTGESIEQLSKFGIAYLKQPGFMPETFCDRIVEKAENFLEDYNGVPGVKILPGLPSHFGAADEDEYIRCAYSSANILRMFPSYEEAVNMVLAMLISAGYEADVLEVKGKRGIGLMFRAMRELKTHTDWAIREIPSWDVTKFIDPAFSQIAVNIDLNSTVYSSVTTIVERSYTWEDEQFKSPDDGFSYGEHVTLGYRSADYMMLKGDLTLFNSNCYHRVWVRNGQEAPRYTLGGFIVKLKGSKKLLLFA
jgi:hypothetical protein